MEAPAWLCGAKLVARCAGTFPQHLQTCLRVESRERGGRHARHCLWPRMCRQRGHRRRATVGQPAHLQTRDSGDLPEVVVPHALCFAQIRPAALLAFWAGIRIRVRGGIGDAGAEARAQPVEVTRIVGIAERALGTIPEHDAHAGGPAPLRLCEQPAIEAELQHAACAWLTCQLGVEHLVAPGAKGGRGRDTARPSTCRAHMALAQCSQYGIILIVP